MQDTPQMPESAIAEFVLSNAEAVLAGTLALMTALVYSCCEQHRQALRQKVIANLVELERHAQLSQQFRAVASHLQQQWCALDDSSATVAATDVRLWHTTPEIVQ